MAERLSELALPGGWRHLARAFLSRPEAVRLNDAVARDCAEHTVYPPRHMRFRALECVAPEAVRVVVLGQDPYHGPGQAMGLSFSVPHRVRVPPSLRNIYRELYDDVGIGPALSGDLTPWAEQGVLLLNSSLSVRAGQAGSHAKLGWQVLTKALVDGLAAHYPGRVFMLWGSHAQHMGEHIDPVRNLVLQAPHPSPLSAHRGFFGCRHFSLANDWLDATGQRPVDWSLA